MILGHLQIMLAGYLWTVTDPAADNMAGERFFELGLAARPHVVEYPRPRFQASSLDNPCELRTQVAPGITVASDHILGSGC
jgi:hypothetical protein